MLLGTRRSLLGRKGQNAATFLLRDEFTTDRAAGAVNGTAAEPGPGNRTVTDTGTLLSVGSDRLLFAGVTAAGNPSLYYAQLASQAGRLLLAGLQTTGGPTRSRVSVGFNTITTGRGMTYGFSDVGAAVQPTYGGLAVGPSFDSPSGQPATHEIATVLRASGAFYIVRHVPLFGDAWLLWWIEDRVTAGPFYPFISCRVQGSVDYRYVRAADLSSPWNTDYGIATQRLAGARAPGDTFTHEANCLIEFTVATLPTADQIELRFRVQDATNYWQVTIDSAGNLDLDEVVAGVVTQRGTEAGVVANSDRIVIVADGTTIRVFEASTDTRRITYAAAANFQTETDGELETEGTGGAVTDIVSWPRTLSGAALAELQRYAV